MMSRRKTLRSRYGECHHGFSNTRPLSNTGVVFGRDVAKAFGLDFYIGHTVLGERRAAAQEVWRGRYREMSKRLSSLNINA